MTQLLKKLRENWDEFARKDPFWAIFPLPEKKDRRWNVEELFATGKKEIELIMEYVENLGIRIEYERALDFGCGVGRLTQALCGYFNECIGVDISPYMLKLARKYNRFGKRCQYVLNSSPKLEIFKDETFDFIYSNIVFQHLPPNLTLSYISEFIRILKKGGVIIFQITTGIVGFKNKLRRLLNYLLPEPLRRVYKMLRYKTWGIKDMFCIKEETLNLFIKSCGGKIIDIVDDNSALPRYIGRRYCITK